MSSKSPAFQFYPTDFLAGSVATYSLEERGAYITLLAFDWSLNGLPNDEKTLAKLCGISSRAFAKVWAILGEQFDPGDDGRLRNPRLQAEREKQLSYSRAMSENGSKGGRPRKPRESRGKADGKPDESTPSLSSNTTTTSSVADAPKGDDASQDTASAPLSKPRRKGEPAPFMATFAPVWKAAYGGAMPQGSATALRPVVKELGEEEAVRRFAAYCKATGGQYASVSKFCQTHGAYATSGTAQNRAGLWLAVCREFDLFSYSGNGDAYRAKVERAKASGKIGPAFDAELKVVRPWERLGDVAEPFVEREIANRLGRIAA